MQKVQNSSLNALRVFLKVAEHSSMKQAASDLKVTPGAISHQVRMLEDSLGVKLFRRNNNFIELTQEGVSLEQQSLPGLQIINAALDNVARDAWELRVQTSTSLATRWLIPRLEKFKKLNQRARIRLETILGTGQRPIQDADVTINYYKRHEISKNVLILLEDKCRPYLSPELLSKISNPRDLASVPALQCSQGNWDWELWLRDSNLSDVTLDFAGQFDLDDAALRAAIGGMGMVLAPHFMIEDDIASGRLCALPHSSEITIGYYVIHASNRETSLSRRFIRWLENVTQPSDVNNRHSVEKNTELPQ